MKFNIKSLKHNYTESGQKNPIRWMVLHQTGENEYENTTDWFRCKDYFNDFVAYKHGHDEFQVYGMTSSWGKFDANGGMYVLVKDTLSGFEHNIQTVILNEFTESWGVSIHALKLTPEQVPSIDNAYLLWLSPECFVSTFRSSLITLLLRNCNTNFKFDSFDQRLDRALILDGHLSPHAYFMLKEHKYNFPAQAKHAWYCGGRYYPGGLKVDGGTIHDNGIVSWSEWVDSKLNTNLGTLTWSWQQDIPMIDVAYAKLVSKGTIEFQEEEDEEECDEV